MEPSRGIIWPCLLYLLGVNSYCLQGSKRHRANFLQLRDASEIVVCEEVGEYRAAALSLVNGSDCVLEVPNR